MFRFLYKALLVFVILSLATVVAVQFFHVEFSNENFWEHHGILFLIFLALFPRLTLLLSNVASGGLIWWLGWLITPRLLVATLATYSYWQQNPILVVLSWAVAIGGESSEKYIVIRRSSRRSHRHRGRLSEGDVIDVTPSHRE